MTSNSSYRALVFGASGITGWAVAKEALKYPTPTTFDQVIGLTNRPLTKLEALLPEDERLQLYSGIDLSAGASQVESSLKKIHGIEGVTHVYFSAYTGHGTGFEGIKKANVEILENAILAVERLCPNLQVWIFQTGGKSYGFEFANKIGVSGTPLKESYSRIPEPYASNIMYYAQYDILEKLSRGKKWKFVEVRPDGVSGFVPSNNAMNMAQALGLFLSFYASCEGPGASVAYPGPQAAFTARHTDVSQSLLAHFHIYASLHPDLTASQAFNIGDESDGTSWEKLWPSLTSYFGLVGSGPDESFNIDAYMQEHREEWPAWVKEHGLKEGALEKTDFGFLTMMMGMAVFGREYDLSKSRGIGFVETRDTVEGYLEAFELMREAKIIP